MEFPKFILKHLFQLSLANKSVDHSICPRKMGTDYKFQFYNILIKHVSHSIGQPFNILTDRDYQLYGSNKWKTQVVQAFIRARSQCNVFLEGKENVAIIFFSLCQLCLLTLHSQT